MRTRPSTPRRVTSALPPGPDVVIVGHGPERPNTDHRDGFYSGPPAYGYSLPYSPFVPYSPYAARSVLIAPLGPRGRAVVMHRTGAERHRPVGHAVAFCDKLPPSNAARRRLEETADALNLIIAEC